jgi:hypothetical protein
VPALPTGIITQLTGNTHHPKLAQAYLKAIDLAEDEEPPWVAEGVDNIAFQYWPESLTDSRPSEWNPRSIPGGSHPIYQWTHGGERRLSFTAVFTRDHEPPPKEEEEGPLGVVGSAIGAAVDAVNTAASFIGLGGPDPDKLRNVPIEAAIHWLRYFTYPYYKDDDLRVFEPPKCILVLPGTNLGHKRDEDDIACVMTTCDVTYEAWFPTGRPRIVEVSLEFAEVVQKEGTVFFHNRADMGLAADVAGVLGVPGDSEGGGLLEDIGGALAGPLGL